MNDITSISLTATAFFGAIGLWLVFNNAKSEATEAVKENQKLLGLYENKKLTVTLNFRIHGKKCDFSDSYVYAIKNDIFPFFQNDHDGEDNIDPYLDCYQISSDEISNILNHIEKKRFNKQLYSFYELEQYYGGKNYRMTLIKVLRYAFLDNHHDKILWDKLLSNAPNEANSIVQKLTDQEI